MRKFVFLLVVLLIVPIIPAKTASTNIPKPMAERIIILKPVEFDSEQNLRNLTQEAQNNIISNLEDLMQNGEVSDYRAYWIQNAVFARGVPDKLDNFKVFPEVQAVIPNKKMYLPHTRKSNLQTATEWNLEMVKVPSAWSQTKGEGALIGVLDSGCDSTHPELKDKIKSFAAFDNYGRKTTQTIATDEDGHGTAVSSIIAGNTVGVAPDAKLIVGSVIPYGGGSLSQILAGLQWIADPDNDPETKDYPLVVNMSFGAAGTSDLLLPGIKNLKNLGILPVSSIGNDGEGYTSNPGNLEEVFSVGSVDYKMNASVFSSGDNVVWENDEDSFTLVKPDICAPGESVRVAGLHRTYDVMDGTSFASPHVAGLCALLLSKNPEIAPEDLKNAIISSSRDLGKTGKDKRFGYGLIDCVGSLEQLNTKERTTITISWPPRAPLWGSIKLQSGEDTYDISKIQARSFTYMKTPGTTATVSAFGFNSKNADTKEITLDPLTWRKVVFAVQSSNGGAPLDSTVRIKGSPLPDFSSPDGEITAFLPDGSYTAWATSFGHANKDFPVSVSGDTSMSVELQEAQIAFIDDRKAVFGISPSPIKARLRRAFDRLNIPYFIWSTISGRVSATQLQKYKTLFWLSGGALSAKETGILAPYMDNGGKLILMSGYYGGGYFDTSDSTSFLQSYFHCTPDYEGGATITHHDGNSYKSLALGKFDGFIASTSLKPMSEKSKPMFMFAGTNPRRYAGLSVSSIKSQGIILGFVINDIVSDEDRAWIAKTCVESFPESFSWRATVATTNQKTIKGTVTLGDESLEFEDSKIFIPHVMASGATATVSSFGYTDTKIQLSKTNHPDNITLSLAQRGELAVSLNKAGYILFDDVPVEPVAVKERDSINLPFGTYNVTIASKGFLSQSLEVKVPGSIATTLIDTPLTVLVKDSSSKESSEKPPFYENLSQIGMPTRKVDELTAKDIVSSGLLIWSASSMLSLQDIKMIDQVRYALSCNANIIISGPQLCQKFDGLVNIESNSANIYASMGGNKLSQMLISYSKANDIYEVSLPVLGGGETLATYLGSGPSIVRYGKLIATSFSFDSIDLTMTKTELIRRLCALLGFDLGKLSQPVIASPTAPTNQDTVEVTGFCPSGSQSYAVIENNRHPITLDLEGFFVLKLKLNEGKYQSYIVSKLGNLTSASEPIEISVDRTPPVISVICPRGGRTSAAQIEVLVNVKGAKEVRIDGIATPLSGQLLRKKIQGGTGIILISAVDFAGNRSNLIARYKPEPTYLTDSVTSKASFEIAQLGLSNSIPSDWNLFEPKKAVQRKTLAVFLCKTLNLSLSQTKSAFSDINGIPEESYIHTLVANRIVLGQGKFEPEKPATKEFICQMLANYFKLTQQNEKIPFSDVTSKDPNFKVISMCLKAGLINSSDSRLFTLGKFGLGLSMSREQMAIILYNTLVNIAKGN